MKCKNCNNFGCSYRNSFEKCFYQDDYLDEDFNWQSFRAEAAKDILCALLTHYGEALNETVKDSLLYADVLISKLKEKEKK
jgi:hypothetical protein